MILIRTLVGFWWLDIGCTYNVDALYLVQVALMDNLAHSCHILFQNIFHRIEKSDILGIQDDQCDILLKCISWINKGCLFEIRKQSIVDFVSTHTLIINHFNCFDANLVLTPPNYLSKNNIINSASVVLIEGVLSPVQFCLALTLNEKYGINHIIGVYLLLPNTVLFRFLLYDMMF